MIRTLLALALLAAPLSAQTTFSTGRVETVYTGGPRLARSGMSKPKGTSGTGVGMSDPRGVVGLWDLGDTASLIKGGYDFVPADNDAFARTSGTIPCISGGTPSYPFSVVVWFKCDTTAADTFLFCFSSGADTNRIIGYVSSTNVGRLHAQDSGGTTSISTAASSITDGRWHCGVFVLTAADNRGVYLDTDTTGATSAVSRAPTGIDRVHLARNQDAANDLDGVIAYTAVLPIALSADQRTAIFAGSDPALVAGGAGTNGAIWPLDNDSGADASGHALDLSAVNSPTAQNNLIVCRDLSGGGYHVRAPNGTAGAPTWSGSIGNGQGGGPHGLRGPAPPRQLGPGGDPL